MRENTLALPPILQIHESHQVRDHILASPIGPMVAAQQPSAEWLDAFFAPHVVVAAALAALADGRAPVRAPRMLLVGNANTQAFAPLFHAPAVVGTTIAHLMGAHTTWPTVRLLSHQSPWPGPHLPVPPGMRSPQDTQLVRHGRLRDPGVLSDLDMVLFLPSNDLLGDFALRNQAPALCAAVARGVTVSGTCASLVEGWLLREYLRLNGLIASAPQPIHLETCTPGTVVPRPAFYAWQVTGVGPVAPRRDHDRFIHLHAWFQDLQDGYTEDGLWAGTPDPEGGYVHLHGGYCLSLEDGYVYAPDPNGRAPQRVSGPVERVLHSHPPQHASEPLARWYWALEVLQTFPPDDMAGCETGT